MTAIEKLERWKQQMKNHSESGQTITAWCEENHIKKSTYHYWKKRIREEEKQATSLGKETVVFAKIKTEELWSMKAPKLQIRWKELELEITSKEEIPLVAELIQYLQLTC